DFLSNATRDPCADVLPAPPQQRRGRSDGEDDRGGGGWRGWRKLWTDGGPPTPDLRLALNSRRTGRSCRGPVMRHRCLMGTKKTGDTLNDHYLYFIRENVPENRTQRDPLLLFEQGRRGRAAERSLREKLIALQRRPRMPKGERRLDHNINIQNLTSSGSGRFASGTTWEIRCHH
ncbi:hypothetical protein CEXT_386601, partial [Caerostris extrusa]